MDSSREKEPEAGDQGHGGQHPSRHRPDPDVLPHPEDHASPELYLAALDGAQNLLRRLVFPPHHADRLWRALRGTFTDAEPVPSGDGWRDEVLARELRILTTEIGDDPTALLEEALRVGRGRWAEAAMARGADALAPFRGGKGSSLLGKAIQLGRLGVVERMLDAGVSPDAELPLGWSPIGLAVFHRQEAVARLLADRGADLSGGAERGHGAFRHAAELGDVSLLRFLEERGARVAREATSRGEALVAAALQGHLDVVKHLLDDGVPLDPESRSALLRSAVSRDRTEVLEELMARGFDPLERFGERHLLRDAAGDGLVRVLRRLLHHGTVHGVERDMVEEALREADLWLHERPSRERKEAVRLLSRWLERNPPPRPGADGRR